MSGYELETACNLQTRRGRIATFFMKERSDLEQKFYTLCEPAVLSAGLEIYDLEYLTNQTLLRLYVINPQSKTATLDDCVKVDHALSTPFEENTWIPEGIMLEVSSPGVYRNLKTWAHFQSAIGEIIKVKLLQKLSDGQKVLRGTLMQVEQEQGMLTIKNEKAHEYKIKLDDITKASVDPNWESVGRRLLEE